MKRTQNRKGFSLVEIIVVLSILAVLVGLLLPAVQRVRESAWRMSCQNNLRQLGLSVGNFVSACGTLPTYYGVYPPYGTVRPDTAQNTTKVFGGWWAHLLPYIDQSNIYNIASNDAKSSGWNQPHWDIPPHTEPGPIIVVIYNGHVWTYQETISVPGVGYHLHGVFLKEVQNTKYKILQCGSDPTRTNDIVYGEWGGTNYLGNYNAFADLNTKGMWSLPSKMSYFTDGTSNTVLFGEGYQNCDRVSRIALLSWEYHNFGLDWYQKPNTFMFQSHPNPKKCDNWRAQSGHNGMNVAIADGSVRFVSPFVSQETWTNALLRDDGNTLNNDW